MDSTISIEQVSTLTFSSRRATDHSSAFLKNCGRFAVSFTSSFVEEGEVAMTKLFVWVGLLSLVLIGSNLFAQTSVSPWIGATVLDVTNYAGPEGGAGYIRTGLGALPGTLPLQASGATAPTYMLPIQSIVLFVE